MVTAGLEAGRVHMVPVLAFGRCHFEHGDRLVFRITGLGSGLVLFSQALIGRAALPCTVSPSPPRCPLRLTLPLPTSYPGSQVPPTPTPSAASRFVHTCTRAHTHTPAWPAHLPALWP